MKILGGQNQKSNIHVKRGQDGEHRQNKLEKIQNIIEESIPVLKKDMFLDWKGTSDFWTE